jgi:hypothetical protein
MSTRRQFLKLKQATDRKVAEAARYSQQVTAAQNKTQPTEEDMSRNEQRDPKFHGGKNHGNPTPNVQDTRNVAPVLQPGATAQGVPAVLPPTPGGQV